MIEMLNRLRRLFVPADGSGRCAGLDGASETDYGLLRRYVDTGSEDAFSRVVCRHAGWVYNTCRRALRDTQLAEDATQAVFVLLARKAPSLSPATHIAGWLSQTCRYVVADVRKHRARYLRRQQLARELAIHRLARHDNQLPAVESSVSEALDEALSRLRDADRQAILMHFYEGLSVREMAEQLRIGEEGAKKRLTRALARLRRRLVGAGIMRIANRKAAVPIAALAMLLRSRGAEAAPAHVAVDAVRAVTIPGAASPLAEAMVEAVHLAHAAAATRLMAAMNLAAPLPAVVVIIGAALLAGRPRATSPAPPPAPAAVAVARAPSAGPSQAVARATAVARRSERPGLPPAEPGAFEEYSQPPEARMWPDDGEADHPAASDVTTPAAVAEIPADLPDTSHGSPVGGMGPPRTVSTGQPGKLPAPGPKPRFVTRPADFRQAVVLIRDEPRSPEKERRRGDADYAPAHSRTPTDRAANPHNVPGGGTPPAMDPVREDTSSPAGAPATTPPICRGPDGPLDAGCPFAHSAEAVHRHPPSIDGAWGRGSDPWHQPPWLSREPVARELPPVFGQRPFHPPPAAGDDMSGWWWSRNDQLPESSPRFAFRPDLSADTPFARWHMPHPHSATEHRPRMSAVELAVPEPAAALWAMAAFALATARARRPSRRVS